MGNGMGMGGMGGGGMGGGGMNGMGFNGQSPDPDDVANGQETLDEELPVIELVPESGSVRG